MIRTLVLMHRWMGISFCLLVAMWFSTGVVMHFVPFPALTETERVEGLQSIATMSVEHTADEAAAASQIWPIDRIRLFWRRDGGVYVVSGISDKRALRTRDLTSAALTSKDQAFAIAVDAAQQRGLNSVWAQVAELADYDQWTVPNRFDPYRPFYRIKLNDDAGTELYVSSVTGEVQLDTTSYERRWNYVGSVAHWIYPTFLRKNWAVWDRTVWWLSLASLLMIVSGAVLGTIRFKRVFRRSTSSRPGWLWWHHVLGLVCMTFVLTWSLSGWLSIDHGRLFARGQPSSEEIAKLAGVTTWRMFAEHRPLHLKNDVKDVEWFAFGGQIFRRERTGPDTQRLSIVSAAREPSASDRRSYLDAEDVMQQVAIVRSGCGGPEIIKSDDNYPVRASIPDAPVFRSKCGDVWFDIDSASGSILRRLDDSSRAYRWLYDGLHTFNFHVFAARPALHTALVIGLCSLGLLFSLTGVVIGWRRLRSS